MDQVTIVSITVGGIFLLCVPGLCIWFGTALRGQAADEAEKRYSAEKNLAQRLLSEQIGLVNEKNNLINALKQNIDDLTSGVIKNVGKINDRQKILNDGSNPTDIALELLSRAASSNSSAAGNINSETTT